MSYSLGAAALPSRGRWAEVRTKDGLRYQLTDDDVIWAARAAACEGGGREGPAATLWAWTQRFAAPNYRRNYPTLRRLVQAHSQPINPIWRRDGSKCRPGARYHGSEHCAPHRLARRDRCAQMSWDSIPAHVRTQVEAWATARMPNPIPKAVDFAAASVRPQSTDILTYRRGNLFYVERGISDRWDRDHVTMHMDGRVAGPSGLAGGAAGAVIAAVAGVAAVAGGYYAYRRYAR